MNAAHSSVAYIEKYYNFDDSVLADVERASEEMIRRTFDDIVADFGLEDGPEIVPGRGRAHPIEVLKFTPKHEERPDKVRLLHSPMGSSINDFTVWEAATIFSADPSVSLWLVGGPSSDEKHIGRLTPLEIGYVALTHDLWPVVDPLLLHMRQSRKTVSDHLGYSAAADKAATAIQRSSWYGQSVERGVLIEPATVLKRSLFNLAKAFSSTGGQLQHYIDESACPPYIARWAKEGRMDDLRYRAKLLRATNLAIATALKHDGFADRLDATLMAQPDAIITVGWGTNSELTVDPAITGVVEAAMANPAYGRRVRAMPLKSMYHAGINNPVLYAAMMLQGLRARPIIADRQTPAGQHSIDLDLVA